MTINFINPNFNLINSIRSNSTEQNNGTTSGEQGATAFSDVLNSVLSGTNQLSASERLTGAALAENLEAENAQSTLKSTTVNLDEIFQKASDTYGVPVQLLKAVAKAESNFDSTSESGAGAQGIMQLMPGTAKALGVTDSFDPEQNIMGGAKYLSQQLQRYDGNEILALAAYNAGPGNVKKYNGVPPFEETQNYIRKVMAYAGEPITAGEATLLGKTTSVDGENIAQNFGLGLLDSAASGTLDAKGYETLMSLYRLKMQMNILSDSDSDSTSDDWFNRYL